MEGAHKRLLKVTEVLEGDSLGNIMLDTLLNTCFDHAFSSPDALETETRAGTTVTRLAAALELFNSYLNKYPQLVPEGLYKGNPEEISQWAEELTMQIMTNRPN